MANQYKCSNYGVCAEADKETIFRETDLEEVDGKYICPKCHQELEVLEEKGPGKGKLIGIIAAAVLVLGGGGAAYALLGGKGDKAPKTVPVESVEITPAEISLVQTDPGQLSVTILPEDATDKEVVWETSDENVVKLLDQNGRIQAEDVGTAQVTATAGGKTAVCTVTVTPLEIEGEESGLDDPKPETTRPAPQPKTSNSYNLGWGRYEGPMSGGVPHGLDGEITVTRSYTLDLKKGGESRSLNPGDKLTGCKFKDGKLVSGYIHYKNGGGEKITIGA